MAHLILFFLFFEFLSHRLPASHSSCPGLKMMRRRAKEDGQAAVAEGRAAARAHGGARLRKMVRAGGRAGGRAARSGRQVELRLAAALARCR